MKTLSVLSFTLIIISSCMLIQLDGITNDYDRLSDEEKMKVTQLNTFKNLNNDLIYEISGPQLLNELNTNNKSMVYIFANGCSSENCLPLNQVEYYAEDYGYKLYLVMSGYSSLKATTSQTFDTPLFAINTEYYETNKSRKYLRAFRKDLGYDEFVRKNDRLGSYMFFEGDSLVDLKYTLI